MLNLFDLDRVSPGITEPQREPVELHALIRRVVAHLDLADHTVEEDLQPTTAAVDAAMIERVVENLVVNAVKHTPAGTPVVVRLLAPVGADITGDTGAPRGNRGASCRTARTAAARSPLIPRSAS